MTDPSEVAVIIPAAGRGLRIGGKKKQFRLLGGTPILVRTLQSFDRHPLVGSLVVVVPPDDVTTAGDSLRAEGIEKLLEVVAGGKSRQASVAAALSVLSPQISLVLVHDGVRPLLPNRCITAVIEAVHEFGAAALALPVADTLRSSDGAYFDETVPRSGLYRMQTPQGFRRDWFDEAHHAARESNYSATDDVALLQRFGRKVRIVEGDSSNIKITTPSDLALAEALLAAQKTAVS